MTRHTTTKDHWGDEWVVFEERPTSHGWPVYLGRPLHTGQPLNRTGGNRVIVTSELVKHLEGRRYLRQGADLPIGDTAVKRIRKLLGMNVYVDLPGWWEEHADELATMTDASFAEKHGYTASRVSQMARALFGKQLRDPGWYLQEPARSILLSDRSRADIADDLGISVGSVGRLRWVLKREQFSGEKE